MGQALNFKLKATKTQKENKNSIFLTPAQMSTRPVVARPSTRIREISANIVK